MIEQVGLGLVAGCIVLAALLVARARSAIHGVLWLGVVLAATAVLYVMLQAPFMAGIQLLLYVGGVMTLMILAAVAFGAVPLSGNSSVAPTAEARAASVLARSAS